MATKIRTYLGLILLLLSVGAIGLTFELTIPHFFRKRMTCSDFISQKPLNGWFVLSSCRIDPYDAIPAGAFLSILGTQMETQNPGGLTKPKIPEILAVYMPVRAVGQLSGRVDFILKSNDPGIEASVKYRLQKKVGYSMSGFPEPPQPPIMESIEGTILSAEEDSSMRADLREEFGSGLAEDFRIIKQQKIGSNGAVLWLLPILAIVFGIPGLFLLFDLKRRT